MRKIIKKGEYTETTVRLKSYIDTVKNCFDLAGLYWKDLLYFSDNQKRPIKDLSIYEFYEFIKSIKYVKDPIGREYTSRPKILLERSNTDHPFDCDDRAILSLSFFILKNQIFNTSYLTRLVVSGRYSYPKHIYCEFKDLTKNNSDWIVYDCTYPHNIFGKTLYVPQYRRVFYPQNHIK